MKSMTGYYSLQQEQGVQQIGVELRAVNNRYLDINIRMPHFLLPYEVEMKKMISKQVIRGKLDLYIDIKNREQKTTIDIDEALAKEYAAAYQKIKNVTGLEQHVPLSSVINANGVVNVREQVDAGKIWTSIKKMVRSVVSEFDKMRIDEGKATCNDMVEILTKMKKYCAFIRTRTKDSVKKHYLDIKERLQVLIDKQVDDKMLLTEAAVLAGKSDINEELARLGSHFSMFEKKLKIKGPIGKTLDFICQEMNREINTIGSKQNSFEVSEKVILLKSEVEKLREQLRNIE